VAHVSHLVIVILFFSCNLYFPSHAYKLIEPKYGIVHNIVKHFQNMNSTELTDNWMSQRTCTTYLSLRHGVHFIAIKTFYFIGTHDAAIKFNKQRISHMLHAKARCSCTIWYLHLLIAHRITPKSRWIKWYISTTC